MEKADTPGVAQVKISMDKALFKRKTLVILMGVILQNIQIAGNGR